ncbi:MAG: hypothetical protein A3C50_03290 [Candidatus Staskawiczbacteria bacterium RIFCSPHIGHO2_02_FULL_43_16]|uniref:Uncharacterized protein n=1 Tax=Candidatus Staskawiczbacteria bacterium RIFCSPHIGHO2_01_FULL_41_41 TaxID=1802203 RepID=A0A1G2HUZ2_9BACT|nr:MAG: hypothetical protein A2822_03160 [Candidatus Staskawiczbacteria bacterium RIFCSPHIGHO2_01_FULL_41_41]OGZ68725.1 MAG: hypothetical protein A3C50_03290 [Candidatus Staskawiczbacteria bacterium RIFCSPHIGHO2_02_FULL_43_16]OGZ75188.1 MAG: hypothetical protein A3A12_01215 [Candidatus Staskawiczbacteria bacterium RIFCSPLOWO2_01_FULL_43_17b]
MSQLIQSEMKTFFHFEIQSKTLRIGATIIAMIKEVDLIKERHCHVGFIGTTNENVRTLFAELIAEERAEDVSVHRVEGILSLDVEGAQLKIRLDNGAILEGEYRRPQDMDFHISPDALKEFYQWQRGADVTE